MKTYRKIPLEERANRTKGLARKRLVTMAESSEDSVLKLLSNYINCQMAEGKPIGIGGLVKDEK